MIAVLSVTVDLEAVGVAQTTNVVNLGRCARNVERVDSPAVVTLNYTNAQWCVWICFTMADLVPCSTGAEIQIRDSIFCWALVIHHLTTLSEIGTLLRATDKDRRRRASYFFKEMIPPICLIRASLQDPPSFQ